MIRRLIELVKERCEGTAAVELGLILPFLATLVFGIFECGMAYSNYIDLTEGARAAVRALAQASVYPTQAYSNAQTYFAGATANLTQANLSMTVTVNGASCNSASACDTALAAATGEPVTVTATYTGCVVVTNYSFLPSCTLTATTTEMIE